jgi:OPA family sugar phosphate sensor protein UhpC-like MFS transporter
MLPAKTIFTQLRLHHKKVLTLGVSKNSRASVRARNIRTGAVKSWLWRKPTYIVQRERRAMKTSSVMNHAKIIAEPQRSYSQEFLNVRVGVFISILLGYSCYYLTRNSLTFTAPAMVATPSLGLDITSIGVITSIFPLCYGCSKFVSGVVGDMLSPAIMLGGGLIATGMVNIAFGASSTLPVFCLLWALNGVLQGFGAPSCAKILTSWFAAQERGTYWVSLSQPIRK